MRMAPNQGFTLSSVPLEPVSRTYQYRKVMKPLLERKRRARINRCLDELKELMTGAFQAEGENVAKLEKADILELTVRHLHSLRDKNSLYIRKNNNQQQQQQHQDQINIDRFWDGFRQCAGEVSEYLSKFDSKISIDILSHINGYTRNLENSQNSSTSSSTATTMTKSTTTPTLFKSSKYSRNLSTPTIPSVTTIAKTTQLPFSTYHHHHQHHVHQFHQMSGNGSGSYTTNDIFLMNSHHYQNKHIISKDFHDVPNFYQERNHENVWRPW